MTEQEWLTGADPGMMAFSVRDRLSDRQLRLFGCACVRGVWEDLPDDALRLAIEACERFADGLAAVEELRAARELADGTYEGLGDIIADHGAIAVTALCEPKPWFPMGEGSCGGVAAVAAEACFNEEIPWHVAWARAKEAHCHLLRDMLGNPFGTSPPLPPGVLAWHDRAVPRMAQAIYNERKMPEGTLDTKRLAILADALLDAGCEDEDLIAHCRSEGPHVRGCWAIDLILGRS
jgi:hypothetical protein